MRLLEFLARSLHGARILAVGTYRAGETARDSEITAALADLARAGRPLLLGGLSRNEVLELATAHSPQAPSARLVERLHALTEGNPLFVDEVMRLLLAEGALSALPSGRLPVPDGVRETIRRRLDPLPQEAVDVLTAAAVIGPEFALETLARVVSEERPQLLQHLDSAREAGLVEERAGEIGRYHFSHALIRETLYDDLPAHERVALHVAVGETLVELYGDRTDIPHSELAYHFLQAAPTVDPARAAVYAVRAGEYALSRWRTSRRSSCSAPPSACSTWPARKPAAAPRSCWQWARPRCAPAASTPVAGRSARPPTPPAAPVTWSCWPTRRWPRRPGAWPRLCTDEEGLIPLLEEALDQLPEADGALRARLLARLAAALYWSATAERRESLAEEAIAMARRVGDPATLAFVLSDAHLATWDPDSPERALPWASEIYALAERVGNVELAMAAHSWRISLLLERGELAWPTTRSRPSGRPPRGCTSSAARPSRCSTAARAG